MLSREDYNNIPVSYCAKCLSLLIVTDEIIGDYCKECGSTNIKEAHIEDWEKENKKKEQLNYINQLNYGKGRNKKDR